MNSSYNNVRGYRRNCQIGMYEHSFSRLFDLRIFSSILCAWLLAMGCTQSVKSETPNQTRLLNLASEHFPGSLTFAEKQMLLGAATGTMADCVSQYNRDLAINLAVYSQANSTNNTSISLLALTNSANWPGDCAIRADLIKWLCTEPVAASLVTYFGIGIIGARIDGVLDLSQASIPFRFRAYNCVFADDIQLHACHIRSLEIVNTHIKSLRANRMRVDESLNLNDGFRSQGEVNLQNAIINGDLSCEGGFFINTNGYTICADGLQVHGALMLRSNFTSWGEIRFLDSHIDGLVDCTDANFLNLKGRALSARRSTFENAVYFNNSKVEGTIDFSGAEIGGDFSFSGVHLSGPLAGDSPNLAVDLGEAKIGGAVLLNGGFDAEGCLSLFETRIEGDVFLDGSCRQFNSNLYAVDLAYAEINGSIYFGQSLRVKGSIRCLDAKIGHDLNIFSKASLDSLVAPAIHVQGNVAFGPGSGGFSSVLFVGARINGAFEMPDVSWPQNAQLDLRSAKIGTLADTEKSWLKPGHLLLNNFEYENIGDQSPLDASSRLRWLRLQPTNSFYPQPYEQLAVVFGKAGQEDDRIITLIAKNDDCADRLSGLSRLWWGIKKITVAYGYKPSWALRWSCFFLLAGWVIFKLAYRHNIIAPTDPDKAYRKNSKRLTDNYPSFNAFIFSLESLVPLLNLQIGRDWAPSSDNGRKVWKTKITWRSVVRAYYYCHIILGWGLTSLWVAAFTGIIKT